jgi:Fe(3+) dicitrate transport protein
VHRGFGPPGPGADAETEAEESVNYELGARIRRGALQAQAVGFLNDYENVLGAATLSSGGDGSGDLFNGGEVDVRGVELSLDWDAEPAFARALGARVPVRFAYTVTRAEFGSSFESGFEPWGTVEAGDELPYVPDHQLHAGVGLESGTWAVRLASTWVGEMRTEAGSGPILEGTGTDDFLIFGLTGELAVTPWSRVFASVQNLTDEAYVVARRPDGARPGLPRTLAAGIRLTP